MQGRPTSRGFKLFVLLSLLVALVIPAVLHLLYKLPAPAFALEAVWGAGEMLDYIGSILGAAATIGAVWLTIRDEREGRLEEQRLSTVPLVAITALERHVPAFDMFSGSMPTLGSSERENKQDEYEEFEPNSEFIVVSKAGQITYISELTERQKHYAHSGPHVPERLEGGFMAVAINNAMFLPLRLYRIGNGPAVNVSVSMERDGEAPLFEGGTLHLSTRQMAVGTHRYVGILFEDYRSVKSQGSYGLIIRYEDTLGHRYEQRHDGAISPSIRNGNHVLQLSFDCGIERREI